MGIPMDNRHRSFLLDDVHRRRIGHRHHEFPLRHRSDRPQLSVLPDRKKAQQTVTLEMIGRLWCFANGRGRMLKSSFMRIKVTSVMVDDQIKAREVYVDKLG